uniref:Uncharacterized protein n=1 Tax=Glossina brevipalpis TaxID=37001 RepID=A0A1A9W4T5_9MUSC
MNDNSFVSCFLSGLRLEKCNNNVVAFASNSAGDPYDGCGCAGILMPGISIIQRRRVLRGRFISKRAVRAALKWSLFERQDTEY